MSKELQASLKTPRGVLACAAVAATLVVVGTIDMLARHYGARAQVAAGAANAAQVASNRR